MAVKFKCGKTDNEKETKKSDNGRYCGEKYCRLRIKSHSLCWASRRMPC